MYASGTLHRVSTLRPWSNTECTNPSTWTTNRSLLVKSRAKPSSKDRPLPARPYHSSATGRHCNGVSSAPSPRMREVLQHLPTCVQFPKLCPACIPLTNSIHAPTRTTIAMTNYIHVPTVTNSSVFHSQP